MATEVPLIGEFVALTPDIQTAAGIVDDNAPGHKMLAKLGEGLARIRQQWVLVANAVAAPAAAIAALAAMEKFIIVEKYPGGSRKNRQSKKRKNHRNHSNNKQ
jgi:hypothetical protein